MTERTPESVFKDYVKAIILEIYNANQDLIANPDARTLSDRIVDIEEKLIGLPDLENQIGDLESTLDNIDVDAVSEIGTRLERIEEALGNINSDTSYF